MISPVASLPSVDLETMNAAAALQHRTDRKYILGTGTAERVLADLPDGSRVLEIAGRRDFGYHSVYFDTEDLASYHLSAHRRRRRFKVRTRTYEDTGSSFLELKTRGGRGQTIKERIAHPPGHAQTLTPTGRRYLAERLDAAWGHCPEGLEQLHPVLTSRYRRQSVLLPEGAGRITVDTGLIWEDTADPDHAFTLSDQVILETKSAGAAGPLDRLLWRAGIRPVRISKFATGLAVLHPHLPANRWHRTLTQHRVRRLTPTGAPR
ncbi:polyphosphate polymerase domain-containing protein [Zhihengliuella flava]|uniref:VTC domain-containing protein n=1 Tax=Zhihengliuella flava TaxID=1285193 RepID=A0A931DDS7_9MICC|nr:polyphosphate polymerase domain-containing protein [Zhihengliuella flava]MBG6084953.1 hypothetical protein [Zhihengliuella flava]